MKFKTFCQKIERKEFFLAAQSWLNFFLQVGQYKSTYRRVYCMKNIVALLIILLLKCSLQFYIDNFLNKFSSQNMHNDIISLQMIIRSSCQFFFNFVKFPHYLTVWLHKECLYIITLVNNTDLVVWNALENNKNENIFIIA